MDNEKPTDLDGTDTKHETARRMAEAALDAQTEGEQERADLLMEKAGKTDPQAVEAVLSEHAGDAEPDPEIVVQDDEEIAALSRTIEPGSASPSREGITGGGSGADSQ